MIRITHLNEHPSDSISYRLVGSGGKIEEASCPVLRASVEGLPVGLAGVVATSDLQGVVSGHDENSEPRLLGHAVAEGLHILLELEGLEAPQSVGVILAGDLFSRVNLDRRGGTGDVRDVWVSFRDRFRWACGVAGNHDAFGVNREKDLEFEAEDRIHFLDGRMIEIDGLKIAGVGGIVGNPRRPFRRTEPDYLDLVSRLAREKPDLLVLHQSPIVPEVEYKGLVGLRDCLERAPSTLVICGHCHWPHPGLWSLENGTQILNVEGRAVLLS